MTDDTGSGQLDPVDERDPNRLALASIDAVHDADPATLNEPVASLRRFVRFRRPLYYSVLSPFGWLSRRSPLAVLVTGSLAVVGALVSLVVGAPPWAVLLLVYWAIGGITYHALSVRLASLMYEAAASVGLKGGDVLAMWKG
jgi:hypothetical protein